MAEDMAENPEKHPRNVSEVDAPDNKINSAFRGRIKVKKKKATHQWRGKTQVDTLNTRQMYCI